MHHITTFVQGTFVISCLGGITGVRFVASSDRRTAGDVRSAAGISILGLCCM